MKTKLSSKNELRSKLASGVRQLADMVEITLGPSGKTVIISRKNEPPFLTKDGISVAKSIDLEDAEEQLGVSIIREASEKTGVAAGDGTTTSIVLARAIFNGSLPFLEVGINPISLKRALDALVLEIVAEIEKIKAPVETPEQLSKIAFISSNSDDFITSLISQAIDAVGNNGSITFKPQNSPKTTLELIDGFIFDSGLISKELINDERQMLSRLQEPLIFITDFVLDSVQIMLPVLGIAARAERPLVIIAEDIKNDGLAGIIGNHYSGHIPICAIKAPRSGGQRQNILSDLAVSTGGRFIMRAKNKDLTGVELSDFGQAETVEASAYKTIIAGPKGKQEKIQERISILEDQIMRADINEGLELKERIDRLSAGTAIIHVGGATDAERIETTHRVEDALEAVKSAIDDGVVPGGGTTLLRASFNLGVSKDGKSDERIFAETILKKALQEPLRKILENGGFSSDLTIARLETDYRDQPDFGCDAKQNKIVSMSEAGILDPFKVVKNTLLNSVSAAGSLLTVQGSITPIEPKKQ